MSTDLPAEKEPQVCADISSILKDITHASATLKRRELSLLEAGKILPGATTPVCYYLRIGVAWTIYRQNALRVANTPSAKKRRLLAKKLMVESFAGKLCAVVRAASMANEYVSAKAAYEIASALDPYAALDEPVNVWWKKKSPTSFRMICQGGHRRQAQQILLRDYLTVCGLDSSIDHTRKQSGGEKAFVGKIREAMLAGYDFWCTPDIVKAFSSMKLAHFRNLKLDRRLLRNVAFLPRCAKVNVCKPPYEDAKLILKERGLLTPEAAASPIYHTVKLSQKLARQGLPEGSPVSPLLARGFIGREIQASLGEEDIVALSYMDDLAIGARTPKVAEKAIDKLGSRFEKHPAGPIFLKDTKIRYRDWVTTLGYRLKSELRQGQQFIHAKPAVKRLRRFRARLESKLIEASKKDTDLYKTCSEYWKNWFASQVAWTKVPGFSRYISEGISLTYVDDFKLGIPMGGNAHIIGQGSMTKHKMS